MKGKLIAMGARGFTLIELMIVIGVFGGVAGAGYAIYSVQQRSYLMQEQLVDLQQNVRTFLYYIEKDLRMAGYDPRRKGIDGFVAAEPFEAVFCADIGRPRMSGMDCANAGCDSMPDGSINCAGSGCSSIFSFIDTSACSQCVVETIRYAMKNTTLVPIYTSGVHAGQVQDHYKTVTVQKTFNGTTSTGAQDVIENVQALEFLYNLNNGTATTDVPTADLPNIRSVTVSLLMRTRNQIRGYNNREGTKYCPASNPEIGKDTNGLSICADNTNAGKHWGGGTVFKDSYRRRLVITNIQCRNMALQVSE